MEAVGKRRGSGQLPQLQLSPLLLLLLLLLASSQATLIMPTVMFTEWLLPSFESEIKDRQKKHKLRPVVKKQPEHDYTDPCQSEPSILVVSIPYTFLDCRSDLLVIIFGGSSGGILCLRCLERKWCRRVRFFCTSRHRHGLWRRR